MYSKLFQNTLYLMIKHITETLNPWGNKGSKKRINIVKTTTQPQPNQSWSLHENDSAHHLHTMSRLSQLLLNQFWPNINNWYQGSTFPDTVCQGDICPVNIFSGEICTYQHYMLCTWPKFNHFFGGINFFLPNFCVNFNFNSNKGWC